MAQQQLCADPSEAIEFFGPKELYLKPIAKINISVTLPQLKTTGKAISNWEVMEKLRKMVKPDHFLMLRVSKSSMEFIRFEAEIETRALIKTFIARLDGKSMKLQGFPEFLKVRAAEAKLSFPSRHDWDSFFRDAQNMNEENPGERPDTIHVENLPCKWFSIDSEPDKPSELILKMAFASFIGEVRRIDIPMLDPYRHENQITGGNFRTFNFGNSLTFDAYVQFMEYIGFVKAMDALKGMKLLRKTSDGKAYTAEIKVDFDRTKHLSNKSIRRRERERQRLIELEEQRAEQKRKEKEEEERRKEEERKQKELEELERKRKKQEKLTRKKQRQQVREERRRTRKEQKKMQKKIAMEERKLLVAQRKLESIRILTELLLRAKLEKQHNDLQQRILELEQEKERQIEMEEKKKAAERMRKKEMETKKARQLKRKESRLRKRLLQNWKRKQDKQKINIGESGSQDKTKMKIRSAVVKTEDASDDDTHKLQSVVSSWSQQRHWTPAEYYNWMREHYSYYSSW